MAGIAVAATAGCGFGSGESETGTAELVVTRDHGSERLLSATVEDPPESESVARFLDREADVETSYGGNFIDSIEGIFGSAGSGESRDWFFYVNGFWSPVGAAEAKIDAGDRIWWDYRRWDAAYRVPVVVGSWPAPFAQVPDEDSPETGVECHVRARRGCSAVRERLGDVGAVMPDQILTSSIFLRVLVGTRAAIGDDPDVRELAGGPQVSGVYAEDDPGGGWLRALGEDGEPAPNAPAIDGIVAAVRRGERSPTWIVAGRTARGLRTAIESLTEEDLADRYALAISPDGERFGLPVLTR